jgi:hypothetical protein
MNSNATTSLESDGFHCTDFNAARAFSSFLPGIAGDYGKPLWVFYTNRGQCISSFGVRDKNGAMLEFHPANKAYALTSLLGFRTFIRIREGASARCYEPFQPTREPGVVQRLVLRPHELEIEETNVPLGLRVRVRYFTLPNENLPALVRSVTVENIGARAFTADAQDGLPQIVPYGLEEKLLKFMSRTMEAFAEVRHVEENLPFFKLKVEPSDKPEVAWIHGGFFAFTLQHGQPVPVIADPELVFGSDTSLRSPLAFTDTPNTDPNDGRQETMTACAFAQVTLALEPGASTHWDSYFGQAPDWERARALRERVVADSHYTPRRRGENSALISSIGAQFALLAGPPQLDPYTRQAFLDNTLRGGQPVVIEGPRGARVFHTFTRKHGDMERDYNFFELAPTYWSQGNGNFRDVNQNRRSANFTYPAIDAANIETFFNLIQVDGNNPLVIQAEKFSLAPDQLDRLLDEWHAGDTPAWRAMLAHTFSPGQLLEALVQEYGTPHMARPWFDRILVHADKIQDASHGEGYWVDHWTYNLDLLDSYTALYPDRMRALLLERPDFTYFDNPHVVQPRGAKTLLRQDGTIRQLHSVVLDTDKAALIAQRTEAPNLMRAAHGLGAIYRTTLLAKILNLLAVKSSLFDPLGIGLDMEAEKPGWCDALNGLPGLFGSSTHEACSLRRWVAFARAAVHEHLGTIGVLAMPVEVTGLMGDVAAILNSAEAGDFFARWDQLATRRERFRASICMGISGDSAAVSADTILHFLDAVDATLARGLARAVDAAGLPVSYYIHDAQEFHLLSASDGDEPAGTHAGTVPVQVTRFSSRAVSAFLEGQVHALRSTADTAKARALYTAVRKSALFDHKLGMYRVNTPLDDESFEIGRSKIFSPGWLENESIFLHMHYKFMLETLRSGLATEFFDDLRRGLVAFHDPAVYGRSPLENSSFIASSRFPDAKVHGTGFVARLSGATAEWISMVLHMGLGATPFRMVDGALRFEPRPTLANWLFTDAPSNGFEADSFGLTLFGKTWLVYHNSARRATFGPGAVAPVSFTVRDADGRSRRHAGAWLPSALALELRSGSLASVVIELG